MTVSAGMFGLTWGLAAPTAAGRDQAAARQPG